VGDGPELRTDRLLLRRWRDSDRAPFAALNADPVVMEHLPGPMTRARSDEFVDRIEAWFDDNGWGLWAVEVPGVAPFIGFTGLWSAAHVTGDEMETGWRLSAHAWGRGYAPEAATAALRFAFTVLARPEVVSFTSVGNTNSQRVMQKIGLRRRPDRDFDHPGVDPAAHPHLVRHVVHAASAEEWTDEHLG
jgi:RimJ/RimL family protein N-acetyltransferase